MKEIFLRLLIIGYASSGIVDIIAYWPTVRDLYHHKKASANIASFSLWTTTTGIAFLYAIFIVPDFLLRLVSGMIFFANVIVLTLSINLKYFYNKK